MTFAQRGRSLSVSGFLLAGAIGIISSTQTWLTVERADAGEAILVPGASALVLLAPLSLAVLALGAALSISGKVVRLVFGVLAGATALFLGWSTLQLMLAEPFDAVAATVTEVTGLAGGDAVREVVVSIVPSAWPFIALVGWALLLLSSVVVLMTWRGWKVGGRRYRTDHVEVAHDGPVDAVDSWDELSRGTDPTR
ncbi:Trp biosynthesis-associated membrane protein [Microbacterium sp. PAMC22086]|uniref:Trp biosynthesis-associated membrane protein n=1 Tax=Microbacterium sp. PAMC22086 TaxID=2861281 RepID=UPI001C625108|nr:Trp biosynthesis-associated membrane protein [Microbacterium sp. PAMC22086]QYG11020.1 Trp biosynthesis-associated membrane protein [Microbacterium sp. PAMC22086]